MNSASPSPTPTSRPLPLTTGREALLRDGHDDAFRGLVHDLLAFSARIREIRDVLGSLVGLNGPTYTALISIAHLERQGEVTVTSLAQHLNVSQPFATAEVSKLVADGLVEKVRSVTDRRSFLLSVTTTGHGRLADLAPDQREINDTLFASLDATTFDALAAAVPALVADADRTLHLAAERAATFTTEATA